jgi:cardiolipin synthase
VLREQALSGVKVHILLDWIGGELDDAVLATMRESGIEIRRYNTPHWTNLDILNNRTHRKLLIVDGRIGFTGGHSHKSSRKTARCKPRRFIGSGINPLR